MDEQKKNQAKARFEDKAYARGEAILDNVWGLVDKSAAEITRSAGEKLGLTTFTITMKGLSYLLNQIYQDTKSMAKKGYRLRISFMNYIEHTLMQYWNLLDKGPTKDATVENLRVNITETIGDIIDRVMAAANWRPGRGKWGRKITYTDQELQDMRNKKLDDVIPDLVSELTDFAQAQYNVIQVALSMLDEVRQPKE